MNGVAIGHIASIGRHVTLKLFNQCQGIGHRGEVDVYGKDPRTLLRKTQGNRTTIAPPRTDATGACHNRDFTREPTCCLVHDLSAKKITGW